MKQEEISNLNFKEYRKKVVSETQANAQLRRKKSSLRAHMAAFIATAVMAATSCTYMEMEENRAQTEVAEEKSAIPFDDEKIKMLEENVEIKQPEAFINNPVVESQDKNHNTITLNYENAKDCLVRRGISPEEAEILLYLMKREVINQEKILHQTDQESEKLLYQLLYERLTQEEKESTKEEKEEQPEKENGDLTLTQVFGTGVKKAINDALRINEIIGKEGLSTSEIEQIINKEKEKGQMDISDNRDKDYWTLTGNGYHGINPPLDTSTSVWIPTGEQTSYYSVGVESLKSDPIWQQVSFDFGKVIGKVPYEEMMEASNQPFDSVPVYANAKDAIEKQSPIRNSGYYESLIGSKVGAPFVLVNGVSARVENSEELTRLQAESLAFPLIRNGQFGNGKTVGYMNGSTIVERLSSYLEEELEREKTV